MKAEATKIRPVLSAVLFVFLVQLLSGIWVSYELQRRLDLRVKGTFWPIPFLPSFYSHPARLEWKNRITLLSGSVKIDYNLLPLVIKNSIRVKVTGKNIRARLSGEWAKMEGVQDATIDRLDADLEIAPRGVGEIYFVNVQSPSFQFHIQRTVK